MQRVTEDSRRTEAKLWFSYRENEAKEKALKKQLNKTQMSLAQSEGEINKMRQNTGKVNKKEEAAIVNMEMYMKIKTELDALKQYDIDGTKKELAEKTMLLEQFMKERSELANAIPVEPNTKRPTTSYNATTGRLMSPSKRPQK